MLGVFEGGDVENLSLYTAAQYGDIPRVSSLIASGKFHVESTDSAGYTALHYAAQQNHVNIVSFLLEKGANPNSNKCGATPLHRAAFSGSAESCALLISCGADTNAIDTSFGDHRTPLMKAASQGHYTVCKLLLDAGARTDLTDAKGNHLAQLATGDIHALWFSLENRQFPASTHFDGQENEDTVQRNNISHSESNAHRTTDLKKDLEPTDCANLHLPVNLLERLSGANTHSILHPHCSHCEMLCLVGVRKRRGLDGVLCESCASLMDFERGKIHKHQELETCAHHQSVKTRTTPAQEVTSPIRETTTIVTDNPNMEKPFVGLWDLAVRRKRFPMP